MYKAKYVDTDKALNYINESRRYHEEIRKGLDIAEEIFTCGNFESNAGTYRDGVLDVIYEIGKELDVQSQDIRDKGGSVDEICAIFADRIRDAFAEELTQ